MLYFPNTLPSFSKMLIGFQNIYRRMWKNIYPCTQWGRNKYIQERSIIAQHSFYTLHNRKANLCKAPEEYLVPREHLLKATSNIVFSESWMVKESKILIMGKKGRSPRKLIQLQSRKTSAVFLCQVLREYFSGKFKFLYGFITTIL